jgi:hypothetical protein
MLLLGTSHMLVRGNTVIGNHPTQTARAAAASCWRARRTSAAPIRFGNVVTGNRVKSNAPANLYYDGTGSGNTVR